MSVARKIDLVSVEEYLRGELESPTKNEYVAGAIYAIVVCRANPSEDTFQDEPVLVLPLSELFEGVNFSSD